MIWLFYPKRVCAYLTHEMPLAVKQQTINQSHTWCARRVSWYKEVNHLLTTVRVFFGEPQLLHHNTLLPRSTLTNQKILEIYKININLFKPVIFVYMSQARTVIFNVICPNLFYVEWIKMIGGYSFCWIVNHHCLNFLFITQWMNQRWDFNACIIYICICMSTL